MIAKALIAQVQDNISSTKGTNLNNKCNFQELYPLKESTPPELEDRDVEQHEAPIIQGKKISDLLHHLETHSSVGSDGIHPRLLRELGIVLAELLSIIYQQSWPTGEVPGVCRLVNVLLRYKKSWKVVMRNYRAVSLTLLLGKVMVQIILCSIMWYMQDSQRTRPGKRGLMKGRSCFTNFVFSYDKVTFLVNEGKDEMLNYLDCSKAFDTVSHSVLLGKLADHGLDKCILHWVKNLAG
ncbi:rna-directed dna polymerase from mobile element jockey-like [Pitangus sulphuratus]|nr:rna-directed dna polymerase from mobile element jockey-like [Pitangus sulphuratus]